jgi:uncharacterized NAD(P)/FAD-binding protein YdhS
LAGGFDDQIDVHFYMRRNASTNKVEMLTRKAVSTERHIPD